MKLDEAKEILKNAGYLIETDMSLEDKIANAKAFNAKNTLDDINAMVDDLNNGQCGMWVFKLTHHDKYEYTIVGENTDIYDYDRDDEVANMIECTWYVDESFAIITYYNDGINDSQYIDEDKFKDINTVQKFMDIIRDNV